MILSKETWQNMCKGEADFTSGMVDNDAIEEFDLYTAAEMVLATPQDVEQLTSLNFEGDAYLPTPKDLSKHPTGNHYSGEVPETKVKEEYVRLFRHFAISSFFAYLPLPFWEMILTKTNERIREARGNTINLKDLMAFLGISFYMSVNNRGMFYQTQIFLLN